MSAYIYKTLLDKLFSNALTDGLTEVVSDFILCLCRQMIKSDVIDDVREDFILSLQTLTDYCFSFANIRGGKKNVEE